MGLIETLDWINSNIIWTIWTPVVLLLAGILFTIRTKFTQYMAMTHGVQVVRGIYDDPDDPGAINHFQALSAALSATVGLGNIGGVALAMAAGGPGALFWMWVVGFFGMALKTVEITLAMMYRNVEDPENPHGGAMWVVEKTLGTREGALRAVAKIIAVLFCIALILSTITGGNLYQAWNVAGLTEQYFTVPPIATTALLAVIVGLAILGGIKRIGAVAGRLVPFMVVLYLVAAFSVIFTNIGEVPKMLALVFKSATSGSEAQGAFIGASFGFAFIFGMKRALFSNEAGQGSAPIAHAAAKTDESAREGIVGGIGPFIDTLMICTLTALVILISGAWNRPAIQNADNQTAFLAADVSFERNAEASDDDAVVFDVVTDATVASLPESRWNEAGEWKNGSDLLMIARVTGGAESRDLESALVYVVGHVQAKEGTSPDAPEVLELTWDSVKISTKQSGFGGADYYAGGEVAGLELVDKGVYHKYDGAQLTGHAFDRAFGGVGVGKWLVTLAAWLFAISTMISWSYYGEQGVVYLFGMGGVLPYKIGYLLLIPAAAFISSAKEMGTLIDFGMGAMLVVNLPIILCLGGLAIRDLNNYVRDLKAGKFKRHGAPSITDVVEGRDVEKDD